MVVAPQQMARYAISDLSNAVRPRGLDAPAYRRMRWGEALHRWASIGVDFVQLREKELATEELLALAEAAMVSFQGAGAVRGAQGRRPKLLLNGRPDVAAAARADGVHLPAGPGELRPAQVREVFRAAGLPQCTVSVSCHNLAEVSAARERGADLLLFGPVFEKRIGSELVVEGTGLTLLGEACRLAHPIPVLALGGVTPENLQSCLDAGAGGIAGIRQFA